MTGAAESRGGKGQGSGKTKSSRASGEKAAATPEPVGQACPRCGGALVKRTGKYGEFVGCSNFPKCRYVQKSAPET